MMIARHQNLPLFARELRLLYRLAYVSTSCTTLLCYSKLLILGSRLIIHKNNFLILSHGTILVLASDIFGILKSYRAIIAGYSLLANYTHMFRKCQFTFISSGKLTLCFLLIIDANKNLIFALGPLKPVVVVLKYGILLIHLLYKTLEPSINFSL